MEIIGSLIPIIGLTAESIVFLAGLLMFGGWISFSKVVSPTHSLNRQVGKGLLLTFGAALGFNLISIFLGNSNGWITFLMKAVCIFVSFSGLRIFLAATKEFNKVSHQESSQANS